MIINENDINNKGFKLNLFFIMTSFEIVLSVNSFLGYDSLSTNSIYDIF